MLFDLPCSVRTFDEVFPNETACQDFWYIHRWEMGFCCPRCNGAMGWLLSKNDVTQCANQKCRYQVSLTTGTILHKTRLPFRTWFYAIVHYAEQPYITVRALARIVAVSTKTAALMLRKIRLALQFYKGKCDSTSPYGTTPESAEDHYQPQEEKEEEGEAFNAKQFLESIKQYVLQRKQAVAVRFKNYVSICAVVPPMQWIWREQIEEREQRRKDKLMELEWREIELVGAGMSGLFPAFR
ncbi:IS1595 family transposase [Paenibacillaceae bacterium]|nr:IS1595 family transposase [Paenibacillaceae bacterium]